MEKINFTEKHLNQLKALATEALFNNYVFHGRLNQLYTIYDLLHIVSLNTLKELLFDIKKKIEKLSMQDEWVSDNKTQIALEELNNSRDLINLIIGYKRYQFYLKDVEELKQKLISKKEELLNSQKTPQELISDIDKQLKELE